MSPKPRHPTCFSPPHPNRPLRVGNPGRAESGPVRRERPNNLVRPLIGSAFRIASGRITGENSTRKPQARAGQIARGFRSKDELMDEYTQLPPEPIKRSKGLLALGIIATIIGGFDMVAKSVGTVRLLLDNRLASTLAETTGAKWFAVYFYGARIVAVGLGAALLVAGIRTLKTRRRPMPLLLTAAIGCLVLTGLNAIVIWNEIAPRTWGGFGHTYIEIFQLFGSSVLFVVFAVSWMVVQIMRGLIRSHK